MAFGMGTQAHPVALECSHHALQIALESIEPKHQRGGVSMARHRSAGRAAFQGWIRRSARRPLQYTRR